MAPRVTKAKKATEVATAKKGKNKINEDEQDSPAELVIEEKTVEKKSNKRGKKTTNGTSEPENERGDKEENPPAKKGRKKNAEPIEEKAAVENGSDEELAITEETNDLAESNGHQEESKSVANGKGRKKTTKKETAAQSKAKGKKNVKQTNEETESTEDTEVKSSAQENEEVIPKTASKSRGRKPKVDKDPEQVANNDDNKVDPPTKGKKKGKAKNEKEKSPEVENENSAEPDVLEKEKKETKGKKGKKAQTKEVKENNGGDNEEEAPQPKKGRGKKKEEKGKGDDGEMEDNSSEIKLPKGKRGQKKPVESSKRLEDDDTEEPTAKRQRKPTDEKAPAEDTKKKPPAKNKTSTDYEDLDFSNSSKTSAGKVWNFKIASWNVDGIRAWMNKGGLDYLKYEKPDILCLQEVKCAKGKLPEEIAKVPGYHAYWLCSDQDGYAGVGIYTTKLAINVHYGLENEELDSEGRIITAEYELFYLICTYVPNAGRKLVTLPKRLQWNEEFRKYVKELDKKKPVIICGDMNVAHNEIDLKNPKTNKKNAGFTEEERSGMTDLLGDGFVDTFRNLNPDKTGAYTFWTYMMSSRAKNVGWRLDYFIVSERLLPTISDSVIRDGVYGRFHTKNGTLKGLLVYLSVPLIWPICFYWTKSDEISKDGV